MLAGKTILITGGAGAIGSNLCRELATKNHIIVIDDLSSGHASNLDKIDNLKFIQASILDDSALAEAFKDKPEIVFHLAANFANQNSVDHPVKDLEVNGVGTIKLLQNAKAHSVQKFIFASSSCVYGPQAQCMKEDTIGKLETPYAISKYLGEHYVNFFDEFHQLDTTTLRFFNSYGPGEFAGKYRNVIPNFLTAAIKGKPLIITGTGDETRAFTYVDDVIQAVIRSAFLPHLRRKIINIGNAHAETVKEMATRILEVTQSKSKILYTERRSWDHTTHRKPDIELAKSLLNWEAKTSLVEGLKKYYSWLQPIAK